MAKDYSAVPYIVTITNKFDPAKDPETFGSVMDGKYRAFEDTTLDPTTREGHGLGIRTDEGDVQIQLYKTNQWITLEPAEDVKLSVRSSGAVAYYESLQETLNVLVTVEKAPKAGAAAGDDEVVADQPKDDQNDGQEEATE